MPLGGWMWSFLECWCSSLHKRVPRNCEETTAKPPSLAEIFCRPFLPELDISDLFFMFCWIFLLCQMLGYLLNLKFLCYKNKKWRFPTIYRRYSSWNNKNLLFQERLSFHTKGESWNSIMKVPKTTPLPLIYCICIM